ncbi:DUF6284 family protein [Actinoplanes sp. CA-252034]|uniref:DUF6284 family protein n=1 Tax=Actinoplanes sp. CA-252034 TaxID=3239906 RepID=UPI003D981ABE
MSALLLEELPVRDFDFDSEPTAADLAAIEDSEPLLAAEFEAALAEFTLLAAIDRGHVTRMAVRRARRAEREVIRQTIAYVMRMTHRIEQERAA